MGAGQVLGLLAASVVTGRRELAALGAGLLLVAAAWAVRLPSPAATGAALRPGHDPRRSPRAEVVEVMTLHTWLPSTRANGRSWGETTIRWFLGHLRRR